MRSDPGASEADAIAFIDLFLSAFELPEQFGDHPSLYLDGRFSGRNPYPDNKHGVPARKFPSDDFIAQSGQRHFLPLTPRQELSWRVQLYGLSTLQDAKVSARWKEQVGKLIPMPTELGLRRLYIRGLDAFETMARKTAGVSFAAAGDLRQDGLLAVAAGSSHAPAAVGAAELNDARDLFPPLVTHTFQACYSLPEYGGNRDHVMWNYIGWDGDTQPLGNSIYDAGLAGPGEGPNKGFGQPGVFQPRGGYREYRAVSGPDPRRR